MARAALTSLGPEATGLLRADRYWLWASDEIEVDFVAHEGALRYALSLSSGGRRDNLLAQALTEQGTLLEDEPYADWAIGPRERLEVLRQEARLALARDRAKGAGRCRREAVIEAWASCFETDPACEEAAIALMVAYSAQGQRQLVGRTYEHCRAAVQGLGLPVPRSLDEALARTALAAPADLAGLPHTLGAPLHEEKRLVSVLCAEVVEPQEGPGDDDPEHLRELVGGTLARAIGVVEALRGSVTSISGTHLQAVFGAPEAHEDDPERAVRAALRALSVRPAGPQAQGLQLRIGVETGPAVVGPIGGGAAIGYGVVGRVVATAEALQSRAALGSVLVGPATHRAVEGLFEWGTCHDVPLRDDERRVVAIVAGRPKARAAARYRGSPAPLVGRGAELAVVAGALSQVLDGKGSIVVIVGEPGLGKTRLVQECRRRFLAWAGAGHGRLPLWLEGRGASYASSTPYGLYQQLLSSWVGVTAEAGEEVLRAAMERALQAVMGNTGHLAVLSRVMGLEAAPAIAKMSPEELRWETFAALRAVLTRLVGRGPTVLTLEDLHWADPTSLLLTQGLATIAADGPLLLLATGRPGLEASDLHAALATGPVPPRRITLEPLSSEAEADLGWHLLGGEATEEVFAAVRRGANGNPLFLEERFSSLVETGSIVQRQGRWDISEQAAAEVPQVLERLFRSRLDRLGPTAKDVASTASVLGERFPLALLRAVCEPDEDLGTTLGELCDRSVLQEVPGAPEPTYSFRHALIQEATYEGLVRAQRRRLHGRAAWALEALATGRLDEVAAPLGRHFAAAGEPEHALHYFELAGDHAERAFASDESEACFRAALGVTKPFGPNDEETSKAGSRLRGKLAKVLWRTGRRAEACEVLRKAIGLARGRDDLEAAHLLTMLGLVEVDDYHFDAAQAAYEHAEALLGDRPWEKDPATADQWLELMVDGWAELHLHRGNHELAREVLEAARPIVESQGSAARRNFFFRHLAWQRNLEERGRVDTEMIAYLHKAEAAAIEAGDAAETAWSTSTLGAYLVMHGDIEEGRRRLEASLAAAERSGDLVLQAANLNRQAMAALRDNDVDGVRRLAPLALAAAEALGVRGTGEGRPYSPSYAKPANAKGCLAWLAWQDERLDDVIALAAEAAELYEADPNPNFRWKSAYLLPLIAVHVRQGTLGTAVAAAHELLGPSQYSLPAPVEAELGAACEAWERGQSMATKRALDRALNLAHEARYF